MSRYLVVCIFLATLGFTSCVDEFNTYEAEDIKAGEYGLFEYLKNIDYSRIMQVESECYPIGVGTVINGKLFTIRMKDYSSTLVNYKLPFTVSPVEIQRGYPRETSFSDNFLSLYSLSCSAVKDMQFKGININATSIDTSRVQILDTNGIKGLRLQGVTKGFEFVDKENIVMAQIAHEQAEVTYWFEKREGELRVTIGIGLRPHELQIIDQDLKWTKL